MEQTLGKRIVYHRKRMNLTQERMAELLGVTAQAVSKWENDLSCPDITMLPRLAALFGISTDALLGVETSQETVHTAEIVTPISEENSSDRVFLSTGSGSGKRFSLALSIMIILLGGVLLAGAFLNWEISFWAILWPIALLVYGLFGLFPRFSFLRVGCALLGGYFLAAEVGVLPFSLDKQLFFAAALVLLGLTLLWDVIRKKRSVKFAVPRCFQVRQ